MGLWRSIRRRNIQFWRTLVRWSHKRVFRGGKCMWGGRDTCHKPPRTLRSLPVISMSMFSSWNVKWVSERPGRWPGVLWANSLSLIFLTKNFCIPDGNIEWARDPSFQRYGLTGDHLHQPPRRGMIAHRSPQEVTQDHAAASLPTLNGKIQGSLYSKVHCQHSGEGYVLTPA